ncbi:MAG: sortase [Flexilinea sp.]|nr:sortase [Flexilinea sp.]
MKSGNKLLQWLTLVLCVVMAAGVLAQTAGAAEPTGKCTHATNEGIEYFTPWGVLAADANKWRAELDVTVKRADNGNSAGRVAAMELELVNSSIRYQCTEIGSSLGHTTFSCNSMPNNSLISGVYFLYVPAVTEGTDISFSVTQAFAPNDTLFGTRATVQYPPYPCARNLDTADFVASVGNAIVFYTGKDCSSPTPLDIDKQSVEFFEQPDPFAMVNILSTGTTTLDGGEITIVGNTVTKNPDKSRVMMNVNIDALYNFNYDLELHFRDNNGVRRGVLYNHTWNSETKTSTVKINSKDYTVSIKGATETVQGIHGLTNDSFPLTLIGGRISNLAQAETDGWGNPVFPPDADLDIFFWYENTEGTLGYQNSIFHIERHLNIQFSPECSLTAPSAALYDPCQATRQMFTAKLSDPITIAEGTALPYGTGTATRKVDTATTGANTDLYNFWFMTRKCVNATCDWATSTSAYPYSVSIADGGGSERSYGNSAVYSDIGTRTLFKIRPFGDSSKGRPFAINGVRLVVDEPGTYVIYAFAKYSARSESTLNASDYITRFYVTVNDKDQFDTCSSLANNGYFKANWNDCLDSRLTQLLTFEHIAGKEEAWMENRSNVDIYFPYVQEWSYLPQELQIASLTYTAAALSDAGQPGRAWCSPEGCMVPPYTKLTITGGTFYLDSAPKFDDYRVAYARRETYNIAHLFFSIYVKECEKKIPNTGISLRTPLKVNERIDAAAPITSITRNSFQSPLKVNAKVNNATDYVFTGNSLRIPAIGLGMETPLPIVHVYYEDGSDGMKWDLSTLGNYVGELEGGSYIPYGGNSVLTGHYWSGGVFKNLEHLNLEDEIYIYGNDGVKYIYKVVQKFIAQPDDVYEMFQQVGDSSLTLVTCENYNLVTDEYERRYIVRAVLESQDLYEEGVW